MHAFRVADSHTLGSMSLAICNSWRFNVPLEHACELYCRITGIVDQTEFVNFSPVSLSIDKRTRVQSSLTWLPPLNPSFWLNPLGKVFEVSLHFWILDRIGFPIYIVASMHFVQWGTVLRGWSLDVYLMKQRWHVHVRHKTVKWCLILCALNIRYNDHPVK